MTNRDGSNMARILSAATILFAASYLLLPFCAAEEGAKPILLIYSPKAPGYGSELKRLVDEDPAIDADVQVLESSDIFRVKAHFPNVKAMIIALSTGLNENLGPTLEWFFNEGGGLIGLGFAGMSAATHNASRYVFPVFGSSYVAGSYDPASKTFLINHVKDEADPMTEGVGDFVIADHKVILSYNGSSNTYLPRYPEIGDYKVLFREAKTGAPTMIKYEAKGVSVSFPCFAGDDFERSLAYFGRFTSTDEFRMLFTNALEWVWENENKYDGSMEKATQFFEAEDAELRNALQESRDLTRASRTDRNLRSILIIGIASVAAVAVYWVAFLRGKAPETESQA
jgi:hypothetical protein